MGDQILSTLQDAENNVAMLRALIEAKQTDRNSVTAGLCFKSYQNPALPAGPGSNENEAKYMTYSTIKLFKTKGLEVFRISDSVGLYFIVPTNRVKTAARSALLRIVKLSEESIDENRPQAFLQVGDWVYPLQPGSMVYRSEHKYYLFPDLLSVTPGTSVGVVLPKSCSNAQRQQFETLILSLIGLEEFPSQTPSAYGKSTELMLSARTSVNLIRTNSGVYSTRQQSQDDEDQGYGKRIGAGIKAGGQLLSRGFELGAIKTANAISLGATCLKSTLAKEEQDQGVPAGVLDTVQCAKDITGKVVDISSSILTALSTVTSNIAGLTACYIKTTAVPYVSAMIDRTGVDQSTLDAISLEVNEVGKGIVSGGVVAYSGLETAASILANSMNNNTEEIISHCYGPSAANVLRNAGEVVGNVTLTGINTGRIIDPKTLVTGTAKKTGLALAFQNCPHQK